MLVQNSLSVSIHIRFLLDASLSRFVVPLSSECAKRAQSVLRQTVSFFDLGLVYFSFEIVLKWLVCFCLLFPWC